MKRYEKNGEISAFFEFLNLKQESNVNEKKIKKECENVYFKSVFEV